MDPVPLKSSSALVLTPVASLTFTLAPLPASAPSWWNPELGGEGTATAKNCCDLKGHGGLETGVRLEGDGQDQLWSLVIGCIGAEVKD